MPQKRSVKSKAKSAWLKKVRKTSTKAKAFVGRGSHTMCMAQFKGCRRGSAKVARPEIKDILVAQILSDSRAGETKKSEEITKAVIHYRRPTAGHATQKTQVGH